MSTPSSVVEQLNNVMAVVQLFPDVISAGVGLYANGEVQVGAEHLDVIHQIVDLDAMKIKSHTVDGRTSVIHTAPTKAFPTVLVTWVTAA